MSNTEKNNFNAENYQQQQPFFSLLSDSINFAKLSKQLESNDLVAAESLVRASIITTALSVEASANSVVDRIPASGQFRETIDKLPPMEKFEFAYLFCEPSGQFDRGCREVQQIQELIKLRNDYVHPKVMRNKIKCNSTDDPVAEFDFSTEKTQTNILKIPHQTYMWEFSHAKLAIKAICEFLSFYLTDLFHLRPEKAEIWLSDHMFNNGKYYKMLRQDHYDNLMYIKNEWKAKITFLSNDSEVRICRQDERTPNKSQI